MDVSVIIPTLNEATKLARLLDTLEQMTTKATVEIIVVDGGSCDQTVQVVKERATVYETVQSRGAQLRLGVEKSCGDVLWFLHADSQIAAQTDLFTQMLDLLNQQRISAGFYRLVFDQEGCFFRYLAVTSRWRAKYLGLIFGDQGLFLTRKAYEKVGGFDSVPLMEDWLISRRLRKIGHFKQLNRPIYTSSRRFEQGKWRTHLKMHQIKLLFLLGMSPEKLAQRYYQKGKSADDRKNQTLS